MHRDASVRVSYSGIDLDGDGLLTTHASTGGILSGLGIIGYI
jgi:hypothetical protein